MGATGYGRLRLGAATMRPRATECDKCRNGCASVGGSREMFADWARGDIGGLLWSGAMHTRRGCGVEMAFELKFAFTVWRLRAFG
jgi:hypothetical protein